MPTVAIISEKLTTEPNVDSAYDTAIVDPTFEPTTSILTVVPKFVQQLPTVAPNFEPTTFVSIVLQFPNHQLNTKF